MCCWAITLAVAASLGLANGDAPHQETTDTSVVPAGEARPGPGDTEVPVVSAGDELIPAPDVALTDLGGERRRLSEIEAPVILLHFWTKYRQCEDDLRGLQKLHEEYAENGVVILGLAYSSGTREEVAAYLDELDVTFPTVMCSSEVARQYDVATYPTTFALDEHKHIRYWMYGILEPEHWDRLIRELLRAG